MQDILIRIETQDYEARLATHYDHVEGMDRAMEWFGSEKFREATKRAKVTGRVFYLAHRREPTTAPEHG